MNNKKILIAAIIAIVIICCVLFFITNSASAYLDDYSSGALFENVKNSFSTEGGIKTLDDDVILEFTDKSLDYLVDYTVVKANNAKNINEIGIFKVTTGKANDLKKLVSKYVEEKQQSYRAMDYFPEEVEKIDSATVKVFGNYVVYSFLNEKDTESFYLAIENLIKK